MVRIGDLGETSTPLTPGGFITIAGVRLQARCESGYLEVRQSVVVIGGDNHGLLVRRRDSATQLLNLARQGEEVFASFGAKMKSEGEASERRESERRRTLVAQSIRWGALSGAITGLMMVAWWHANPSELQFNTLTSAATTLLCSTIWGLIIGRVQYEMFERAGHSQLPGVLSGAIMITIAVAGCLFCLVHRGHGLIVSLFSTLSATVVLCSGILALALFGEWMSGSSDSTNSSEDQTRVTRDT